MQGNWLDSYYEALEFFYWEPQHIGRKQNPSSEFDTLEKVVKHLRKMEVTLNHNINQFLLLAPKQLHLRLFSELFRQEFRLGFEMQSRGVDAHFGLVSKMQPDFLFVSENILISIEMKVGAKSSIEQVLKYALLGLAVELKTGSIKKHYLGFLGSGDFSNLWKEKFASTNELHHALLSADLQGFIERQPTQFHELQVRFDDIVAEICLGFINYEHFAEILKSEIPQPADQTDSAEVYRNLLAGLLAEFKIRGLIK